MARRRERAIIETARKAFGRYVKEIRVTKDEQGHAIMHLTYNHGHKMLILQTFPAERVLAKKLLNQIYCVGVLNPGEKNIMEKNYLTAKMVKMAILKTKQLDMMIPYSNQKEGVNKWA